MRAMELADRLRLPADHLRRHAGRLPGRRGGAARAGRSDRPLACRDAAARRARRRRRHRRGRLRRRERHRRRRPRADAGERHLLGDLARGLRVDPVAGRRARRRRRRPRSSWTRSKTTEPNTIDMATHWSASNAVGDGRSAGSRWQGQRACIEVLGGPVSLRAVRDADSVPRRHRHKGQTVNSVWMSARSTVRWSPRCAPAPCTVRYGPASSTDSVHTQTTQHVPRYARHEGIAGTRAVLADKRSREAPAATGPAFKQSLNRRLNVIAEVEAQASATARSAVELSREPSLALTVVHPLW